MRSPDIRHCCSDRSVVPPPVLLPKSSLLVLNLMEHYILDPRSILIVTWREGLGLSVSFTLTTSINLASSPLPKYGAQLFFLHWLQWKFVCTSSLRCSDQYVVEETYLYAWKQFIERVEARDGRFALPCFGFYFVDKVFQWFEC